MKHRIKSYLQAGLAISMIIALGGCCFNFGWWKQEQYERTEQVSAPVQEAEQISVDTSFGEIDIRGADTNDCNVIAKITAQAPTADEAKQLAEQTHIKFEISGKTLNVKADKPHLRNKRSVLISYDIVVPARTAVRCKSSYGEIKLTNIKSDVAANTNFGDVVAEEISGRVKLDTSYGKVDCKHITCSEFSANSSFGDIVVVFSEACPNDLSAKITTSYGAIDADVPKNFAGEAVIETSFGKIKTDLPIMIKGEVSKTRLSGTVGEGTGKLELKTSFGSVTIR